jgi:hypothetical protein
MLDESKEIKLNGIVPFPKTFNLTPPVHVAVICPPGAAVTALLNKMGRHGGAFVMTQSIPMQVGALSKANGQGNVQIFPLLVFAIAQKDFEAWMKCKYEEIAMYNMDDIMNDQIMNPQRN